MAQPAQPVVFMHPPAATTHQQQTPVGLPVQSQVPVIAPPQIISAPIHNTPPAQEPPFGGHPASIQQDAPFSSRVPPVQEPQFVNRPNQPAQPTTQEPPFGGHGAPPTVQEPVQFGGQNPSAASSASMIAGHGAPSSSENVATPLQKTEVWQNT